MFPCPLGGVVIDTPGMREMGAESADLSKTFAEIEELARHCRFRDCTHTSEPGRAVLAAVESGELDSRRLESYHKVEHETSYDGLSSKEIEVKKLAYVQRSGRYEECQTLCQRTAETEIRRYRIMNIIVRNEKPKDHRRTEEVAREAFWNLYFPGAAEHYVVHKMRSHPDFSRSLPLSSRWTALWRVPFSIPIPKS